LKWNGKIGLALLLIVFGVLLLLDKIGPGLGWLMGYLVPIAVTALGYIGIRNGSKFFGWLFFIIGLIMLFGKFAGLIGFLIAVGIIAYGISLLRKESRSV